MKYFRVVRLKHENEMAEVIEQQLHQAKVRYTLGGFEIEEWVTDEDYDELPYFDFDEEDE